MARDGTYRLPPMVDDGSGDPNKIFYVDPPARDAVGRRWNVYRGERPGIYTDW